MPIGLSDLDRVVQRNVERLPGKRVLPHHTSGPGGRIAVGNTVGGIVADHRIRAPREGGLELDGEAVDPPADPIGEVAR